MHLCSRLPQVRGQGPSWAGLPGPLKSMALDVGDSGSGKSGPLLKRQRTTTGGVGRPESNSIRPHWTPRVPRKAVCQARIAWEVPFLPHPSARNRERLHLYQFQFLCIVNLRGACRLQPPLQASCGRQCRRKSWKSGCENVDGKKFEMDLCNQATLAYLFPDWLHQVQQPQPRKPHCLLFLRLQGLLPLYLFFLRKQTKQQQTRHVSTVFSSPTEAAIQSGSE